MTVYIVLMTNWDAQECSVEKVFFHVHRAALFIAKQLYEIGIELSPDEILNLPIKKTWSCETWGYEIIQKEVE